MSLRIHPLSYNLGAEITGVDFSRPQSEQNLALIHGAFLDHSVLLFRGQPVTREQHIAVSGWFGELESNDAAPVMRIENYPQILMVSHKPNPNWKPSDDYVGKVWHTDHSHTLHPAKATTLRGVEVPDIGGDTMFANMCLAYETLSDGMKKLLEGQHAIHPVGVHTRRIDKSSPQRMAESIRRNPPIAQPLVRVHPDTGRKALYLSVKLKQIVGMTPEESAPLLDDLCRHSEKPQFVYRHHWRKDDLLVWDNRCLMHMAVNDFDKTQTRYLERTVIKGTPSGYATT